MARIVDSYLKHGAEWRLPESDIVMMAIDRQMASDIVDLIPPHYFKRGWFVADEHGDLHVTGDGKEYLWNIAVKMAINDGQVIAVDNVYRYMRETKHYPELSEILACTPPFPETWAEYFIPREDRHRYSTAIGEPVEGFAVLWSTMDLYHDYRADSMASLKKQVWRNYKDMGSPSDRDMYDLLSEAASSVRWQSRVAYYAKIAGRPELLGPFALIHVYFDEQGFVSMNKDGENTMVHTALMNRDDGITWDQANAFLYTVMAPTLVAFSFAHCKNVSMDEMEPPERVNKARKRRGHPGLVTYKVLTIDPNKATKGGTKRTFVEGSERGHTALHIVRGHFAWYGSGHPDGRERGLLYGKHAGQFWIPAHVRGSSESGVLAKDYAVLPAGG